ncbi:MAG: hypothetical protein AB7C97_01125 [Oscillospiraceae bacterium]
MSKFGILFFFAFLCASLCACSQTNTGLQSSSSPDGTAASAVSETASVYGEQAEPSDAPSQTGETEDIIAFPFEDEEGRTRYRLVFNGTEVETENYPFTLPEEPCGGYYPMADVLHCLGVECLTNEDHSALATVVNGNLVRVFAGSPELYWGKQTFSAVDTSVVPVVINGALYVPSFLLMQLSGNSFVDFSADHTAATLDTDIVVDTATSGLVGVDEDALKQDGSSQVSTGDAHRCPDCGGVGGCNEQYFDQVMVNGRWQQISKSRWRSCPVCSGRGSVG